LRSTPLNHIYLWSGWIDKLNAPRVEARGHPHRLPEVFFENYTYLWNHFVNFNQTFPKCFLGSISFLFQSYVQYVWGPKKGPRGGLKWLIILIFKNLLVNQQCQKIDTWHITLINLEKRNRVWPTDFDLQLGCCISEAFSIFDMCLDINSQITQLVFSSRGQRSSELLLSGGVQHPVCVNFSHFNILGQKKQDFRHYAQTFLHLCF
jgi:hypothetical protein